MIPRWLTRPAVPADHEAFARLFPELAIDDPLPDRAHWEAEMLPGTILLEDQGAVIAYAWIKVFGAVGYVVNLVVDPAFRGRGAGGALMEAIADRLRAGGCLRWALNVKVDNAPALRLYERCGLARAYRAAKLSLLWDRVAALPRDAAPVTARPVEPAEDGVFEAAFSLPPGRLADLRSRGRVLVRLVDPAHPADAAVGLASFDPALPGAFPFAVARPGLAAPLLEALRPYARSGDTFLSLLVEHDPLLVELLCRDAGALRGFELFHMEGDLPAKG
jgi:ribosomal protein S18 acetylase RimI-like enzyme